MLSHPINDCTINVDRSGPDKIEIQFVFLSRPAFKTLSICDSIEKVEEICREFCTPAADTIDGKTKYTFVVEARAEHATRVKTIQKQNNFWGYKNVGIKKKGFANITILKTANENCMVVEVFDDYNMAAEQCITFAFTSNEKDGYYTDLFDTLKELIRGQD